MIFNRAFLPFSLQLSSRCLKPLETMVVTSLAIWFWKICRGSFLRSLTIPSTTKDLMVGLLSSLEVSLASIIWRSSTGRIFQYSLVCISEFKLASSIINSSSYFSSSSISSSDSGSSTATGFTIVVSMLLNSSAMSWFSISPWALAPSSKKPSAASLIPWKLNPLSTLQIHLVTVFS